MIRNVITGPKTVEIYKVATEMKRGTIVTKNLSTQVADKATDTIETYLVDYDSQPTGCLSDVEVSAYDPKMDTIAANSLAVLIKPAVGTHWATDEVVATGLASGDYLVPNAGKLVKATTGKTSIYKYVGEYQDGDKTLYQFEVVTPHTLA